MITAEQAIKSSNKQIQLQFLTENGYGFKWMIANARVNNLKALIWVVCQLKYPEIFVD
jgi:hypothetical protein